MEFVAAVKYEGTIKIIRHSDYKTKKAFAEDLRANGYKVRFIATEETFDEECEKYNNRLEKNRKKQEIKREIEKEYKEKEAKEEAKAEETKEEVKEEEANMGNIMREAHRMTRELKKEFPEINYKTQLGICIAYLLRQEAKKATAKKEDRATEIFQSMPRVKGRGKQLKITAEGIRLRLLKMIERAKELDTTYIDTYDKDMKETKLYRSNKEKYTALEELERLENAIAKETELKFYIDNHNYIFGAFAGKYNIEIPQAIRLINEEGYRYIINE